MAQLDTRAAPARTQTPAPTPQSTISFDDLIPVARGAPQPSGDVNFDDLIAAYAPRTPPSPALARAAAIPVPAGLAAPAAVTFDDIPIAGPAPVTFDDIPIPAAAGVRHNARQVTGAAATQTPLDALATAGGAVNDAVRNSMNGMTLGYADKLAAAGNHAFGGGSYADELAAQRAESQAAMDRAGPIVGNAEKIGGMLIPSGLLAKGVAGAGALANGVPYLGRVLASPYVQAAATGAGVGAGDAAGNDQPVGEGAATGALAGVGGQALAGVGTGIVKGVAGRFNAAPAIPTADEIHAATTAAYTKAFDPSVIVHPDAAQRLATAIQSKMGEFGYSPVNEPGGQAVLAELGRFPDAPAPGAPVTGVSLQGLDTVRRLASRMGQGSQSGAALGAQIKRVVDDFVNGLQPGDVLAGDAPKAIASLQEARRLAQIGFKSDLQSGGVENVADRAANAPSGGINNRTGSLAINLKNSGQNWTPDEEAAINGIINRSPTQDALRWAGTLSPGGHGLTALLELGAVAGGALSEGAHGAAAALAVPALGALARHVSDASITGKMDALGNLIRAGGNAASVAPATNAVQAAAQSAKAPLTSILMNSGINASLGNADPDSRSAALARLLATQRPAPDPSTVGSVFAQ